MRRLRNPARVLPISRYTAHERRITVFHVHFIWAQSTSGIMGVNGKLPWHDRGDLQHFKDMTTGKVVVMGRKTRQSLPQRNKKLPNRTNIVLSRTMKSTRAIKAVASPYAAIEQAAAEGKDEIWVIGGHETFQAFIKAHDLDKLPFRLDAYVSVLAVDDEIQPIRTSDDITWAPVLDDRWVQLYDHMAGLRRRLQKYVKVFR